MINLIGIYSNKAILQLHQYYSYNNTAVFVELFWKCCITLYAVIQFNFCFLLFLQDKLKAGISSKDEELKGCEYSKYRLKSEWKQFIFVFAIIFLNDL